MTLKKRKKKGLYCAWCSANSALCAFKIWSGYNTPVTQKKHICTQSESERAAVHELPLFFSRCRRLGYRWPYTCIVTMLRDRPSLGHFVVETRRIGDTTSKNGELTSIRHGLSVKPCKRGALGVAIALSSEVPKAWERAGSKIIYFGPITLATRLRLNGTPASSSTYLVPCEWVCAH
jgi:hypothetical protein